MQHIVNQVNSLEHNPHNMNRMENLGHSFVKHKNLNILNKH